MSGKITNDAPGLWNVVNTDSQSGNVLPSSKRETPASDSAGASSKLFETNAGAQLLRQQITARYIQSSSRPTSNADLERRADKLSEILSGGGKRSYESVAPCLRGLSDADAKQLRAVYQQKTGRDLLVDVANHLFMDDTLRAFRVLAPEKVHAQTEAQAMGTNGRDIKMEPPTKEVLLGAQVQYTLALPGEVGGDRKVSHLIRGENANLEEAGASFTANYQEEKDYGITFQVRYGNQPPEFYTYGVTVKNAADKAAGELSNLAGSAPDSELYLKYLDGQIGDARQAISELETKRDALYADIRGGVGNSADKYTEFRAIEKQLGALKSQLPEMETARTEVFEAFSNSVGKPIPLKAVLIANENGQTIPLQLYAKNLGGGKWAIVDVTNPSKPRTWTGEGALPADALNQAWNNFVSGTNDLPGGQIAAQQPQGLGFQANKTWNNQSSGQSTLKQWSNGLGVSSIALAGLGVAAVFGPGTQGLAVPLLLASGVLGGASAGTNLADRARNGTFEWKSTETALDMLGIVGGVASLGGIGAMTNVGRTVLANGAKYTVQNLGNFTRIAQVAEQGTNAAGAILIANQYVSAIDNVNRSSMTPEQKATETRKILMQAAAMGGLMVLGVGVSSKLARASQPVNRSEIESWIGREIKRGDPLPEGYQWQGNQIRRRATFVEKGYAPLQINAEGRIAVREGVERLSNPNRMRNNFKAEVETRLRARGLTGEALRRGIEAETSRVQIHHIIPDELGQAAQKAGYNLDEASNLTGMPRQPGDRLDDFDVEHRGSHPGYTKEVSDEITQTTQRLKTRYKTDNLENVPANIIRKEMKRIENDFRNLIKQNQVPLKDGRLSFNSLPPSLNTELLSLGGRYEIRA